MNNCKNLYLSLAKQNTDNKFGQFDIEISDYKKIINHCATAPLLAKNLVEPNTLEEILTKEKTMFDKIKKSIFSKKLRAGEKVSHFKNANAQLNDTINELFPEGLQANNSMNN